MKIKTNKATGCECVPLKAIKESAEMLWHPYSELFNNIPDNSSIHQQCKLGEVPPVFKTDCCLTKSHYKPLTILASLSKVLEALVHSRIGVFSRRTRVKSLKSSPDCKNKVSWFALAFSYQERSILALVLHHHLCLFTGHVSMKPSSQQNIKIS